MEGVLVERAEFIVDKLSDVPSTARLLVAIAGVPASGKTSFSIRLVQHVNALLEARASELKLDPAEVVLVGLDGWHLTRAQLDAMDDPRRAHDRRGSHWTFDAPAFVDFVARLRDPLPLPRPNPASCGTAPHSSIYAPSFDHAVKDPVPNAFVVTPSHRIVIIEGLYTMLNVDPWRQAAVQVDERWWIQVDPALARTRLVQRHVRTGVAKDLDEAVWRAENNDEDSK